MATLRQSHKLPFAGITQIRFRGCFSPACRIVNALQQAGPLAFAVLRQHELNYSAFDLVGKYCAKYKHNSAAVIREFFPGGDRAWKAEMREGREISKNHQYSGNFLVENSERSREKIWLRPFFLAL